MYFEAEMDCMVTMLTLFWRSFETFRGMLFGAFFFPTSKSRYHYMGFLGVVSLLVNNIKTFMLAV